MTRHRAARTIAIVVVLVAVGLGLAALPWAPTPDTRTRVVQVVADAEARTAARCRSREVAWGETREGSAFACYVQATAAMPKIDAVWWDVEQRQLRNQQGVLAADTVRERRAAWAAALQHMVEGAHRRDATPHSQRDIRPLNVRWLVDAEVGLRLQERRTREAMQLWLDGCTFQLDCSGPWWPQVTLWGDRELQALDAGLRDEFAAGLLRLEARLQEPPDPVAEFASHARPLLEGRYRLTDWHWREIAAAWQWGFDPTARHLAVFEQLFAHAGVLEPAATTGPERDAQWQALRALPWVTSSYMVDNAIGWTQGQEKGRRLSLARLRLLRLALAFHQRAPLPVLLDPFTGEPLASEVDGDVAVFRTTEGKPPLEQRAVRR